MKSNLAVILFEDKADFLDVKFLKWKGIHSYLCKSFLSSLLNKNWEGFFVWLFVLLSLFLTLLSAFSVNRDGVEIVSSKHVLCIRNWNVLFQFLALLSAYHLPIPAFSLSNILKRAKCHWLLMQYCALIHLNFPVVF